MSVLGCRTGERGRCGSQTVGVDSGRVTDADCDRHALGTGHRENLPELPLEAVRFECRPGESELARHRSFRADGNTHRGRRLRRGAGGGHGHSGHGGTGVSHARQSCRPTCRSTDPLPESSSERRHRARQSPVQPRSRSRGPGYVKWVVLGIVGLVVLMFAGIFFYANVINDAPDKLDAGDLSNALVQTTPPVDTVEVRESVPENDAVGGNHGRRSIPSDHPVGRRRELRRRLGADGRVGVRIPGRGGARRGEHHGGRPQQRDHRSADDRRHDGAQRSTSRCRSTASRATARCVTVRSPGES